MFLEKVQATGIGLEKLYLEKSRLPRENIIKILQLWFEGLSQKHICMIMMINPKTYRRLMSKISMFIVEKFYNNNILKIGGNNTIVEIDESKFGLRKYNKGHKVDGVWVLGMVERTQKKNLFNYNN